MKGGVTFFRSSSSEALRTYFFSPEAVNTDYYLGFTPEGHAERMIWTVERGLRVGEIGADGYAAWVDFSDSETGESRGTVRKNSVRFVEKNINVDKSLSLAAAVNSRVEVALNSAQRQAAEAMTAYVAEHARTRIGPAGAQRQVRVERIETVTHAHAVSRENEPHPHIHWQVGARVFAEGKWRQLDTADFAKHSSALNALGENAMHADPELRRVLAAEGYTFDPATGQVTELGPYVEAFSTRAAQIRRNKELLEANWKADPVNAGKVPGPGLRSEWDHMAWNGTAELTYIDAELIPRPAKEASEGGLKQRWAQELAAMGFQAPESRTQPSPESIYQDSVLDRGSLAQSTLDRLAGIRSTWSTADIRAEATRQLTASGYAAEPDELATVREKLVAAVEAQCRSISDPRIAPPETARHWTNESIIETEDELKTRLAARAAAPGPVFSAADVQKVYPRLNDEQAEAAAVLTAGTRLSVIEGYAGAGKTALLKAAAESRGEEAPMLTVTPTLKAAQQARSAGADACSLHKLLHVNGYRWNENNQWSRLTPGEADPATGQAFQLPAPGDEYYLAEDTQLVVDEAGMLDQQAAHALLRLADEREAGLALMGDRAQLAAVGRGGVLDIAARTTTHHVELDQVHRFGTDADYAEISQKLRNREDIPETFDRLHQRGNVRLHATEEEALHAVASEAVAEIQAKRSIALTVPTNAKAAELNRSIQAERLFTGQIKAHPTPATGSDGLDIHPGDTVMTRSNNKELGVANRESFRVVSVHQHGALTIAGEDDRHHRLDADYVAEHVHLGYAVTDYGNQGSTVDHGSVFLEEGMSGGGAYVGATRGRQENTIHIVAEDPDQAREKFTQIMGTDRADRGLDQARRELAEELAGLHPEPAPQPLSERAQRYLETLEERRHTWQQYAEYTKPLHKHTQQVEDFRARYETTLGQARRDANDAARQSHKAQQEAAQIYQQRRAEIYQQTRQRVGHQMRSLQTQEGHARNAGLIDVQGHKPKARQMREALEIEHGMEAPRGKRRIKNQHWTEDHDWVDQVAKKATNDALPADPSVLRAQEYADRAAKDAQHATENKERIAQQWNTEVGDAPKVTLRRDRAQKPITYEDAQHQIKKLDQRITWASNPENQAQVLETLDNARQRQQKQATKRQAARTRRLDPLKPVPQTAYMPPPTRDTGPEIDL